MEWKSKARIGFLGNDNPHCDESESRIGFGTGAFPYDTSCGNSATYKPDNGNQHIDWIHFGAGNDKL